MPNLINRQNQQLTYLFQLNQQQFCKQQPQGYGHRTPILLKGGKINLTKIFR